MHHDATSFTGHGPMHQGWRASLGQSSSCSPSLTIIEKLSNSKESTRGNPLAEQPKELQEIGRVNVHKIMDSLKRSLDIFIAVERFYITLKNYCPF